MRMGFFCFFVAVAVIGCAAPARLAAGGPGAAVADALVAGDARSLLPADNGGGNPDNPRLAAFYSVARYPSARVVAVNQRPVSANCPATATVLVSTGTETAPVDLQYIDGQWSIATWLYD